MADMSWEGLLECPICKVVDTSNHGLRCANGHWFCTNCASCLGHCPLCRSVHANDSAAQNSASSHRDDDIQEISIHNVELAARPFAGGTCADLYSATWRNLPVALKVLRQHLVTARNSQELLHEARVAMSLNHPNVVRVFGIVSMDGCKGILMEKADKGSLRSALNAVDKLSPNQLVSISIDIVDGLDYIHSKQLVHRDLKPENILLFDVKARLQSQVNAKIADFGLSRVIQASLVGTAMIGTPFYMAPELFGAQARYGSGVDVYSLAIVLYEVFSGRHVGDTFASFANSLQLMRAVEQGKRPEIPESFPTELQPLVERGWSAYADVRPTLAVYRAVLCNLLESTSASNGANGSANARASS